MTGLNAQALPSAPGGHLPPVPDASDLPSLPDARIFFLRRAASSSASALSLLRKRRTARKSFPGRSGVGQAPARQGC
ncbi:hypothetical protein QA658_18010 [Proteus mirabilis]|nr:hypothetical protein [Proteus mirabilis]